MLLTVWKNVLDCLELGSTAEATLCNELGKIDYQQLKSEDYMQNAYVGETCI